MDTTGLPGFTWVAGIFYLVRHNDHTPQVQMNTAFLLMAQYNGKAVIPVDTVRADYFQHLPMPKFLRKVSAGEIKLPLVRIENSQKSARGVHLGDLADYLDARRAAARKEMRQLAG